MDWMRKRGVGQSGVRRGCRKRGASNSDPIYCNGMRLRMSCGINSRRP